MSIPSQPPTAKDCCFWSSGAEGVLSWSLVWQIQWIMAQSLWQSRSMSEVFGPHASLPRSIAERTQAVYTLLHTLGERCLEVRTSNSFLNFPQATQHLAVLKITFLKLGHHAGESCKAWNTPANYPWLIKNENMIKEVHDDKCNHPFETKLQGQKHPKEVNECRNSIYRQVSNIRHALVGNKIVDHSDVVGASPVGAAPTTSSFSTYHMASLDWAKTTARRDEKQLSLGIWCDLH